MKDLGPLPTSIGTPMWVLDIRRIQHVLMGKHQQAIRDADVASDGVAKLCQLARAGGLAEAIVEIGHLLGSKYT